MTGTTSVDGGRTLEMNLGNQLWSELGGLGLDDLPTDVVTAGRQCLLDWLGCAVSGSREPAAMLLRQAIEPGRGNATILGSSSTGDPRSAALVNGTAGHALDYDDTNRVGGLHMTAPVAPAALALAEHQASSGAELLLAFVIGAEMECRYGAAISPSHYVRGWHSTSMIGPFGAAAASCRLLGLDGSAFGTATGIAASQAGGVQANFGSMTKPLHAGLAAEAGVIAAMLAARGFSANPAAFEARRGLAEASSDGPADLHYDGPTWALPDTMFKFHASCHGSHPTIECTARLTEQHVTPLDIESVEVRVHPSIADVCHVTDPTQDLQTKFCLPVVFAATALGLDTADPSTFSLSLLENPDLNRLRRLVSVVRDASHSPTGTELMVRTFAGSRVTVAHDLEDATIDLAVQGDALRRKFRRLATPAIGDRAEAALSLVEHIEDLEHVAELSSLLREEKQRG